MSFKQIRYGSKSALDVQPFNEGSLYFVQDGNQTDLYADLKGERTKVTNKVFYNIFNETEKKQVLLQSKVVIPGKHRFIISADEGYDGLYWVEVKPIPDNYADISQTRQKLTEEITQELTVKLTEELTEKLTEELTEKITQELTEKITNKIKEENVNSFDNSVIIDTETFSMWMDNE